MRRTHDNRLVYPFDAQLPADASGWTLCEGNYATWLETEDQPRARDDYQRIEKEVGALRTKKEALARCTEEGLGVYGGKLKDMRLTLQCHLYAKAWPLREAKGDTDDEN